MAGNEPKQHHIVPRAYLEGFVDLATLKAGEGKVWLYIAGRTPFPQKPERLAKRNYYYCYERNGQRQFDLEKGLQKLEDLALPVLQKLRDRNFKMTDDERMTFAGYVALSYTRVPTFERMIDRVTSLTYARRLETIATDERVLKAALRAHKEQTGEHLDAVEFKKNLTGGEVVVTQEERGWSLRQSFELGVTLQPIICEMPWTFLLADHGSEGFVTSDNPVALFDPAGMMGSIGFASSPEAYFTFPICRDVCLMARYKASPLTTVLSGSEVRTINKGTIGRCDMQIYAPFRSEKIQKILDETGARKATSLKGRVLFSRGKVVEE